MLKFSGHAAQAVAKLWPADVKPLDQYERGEPMDKDLVWAITQRQPSRTQDQTRYVLSADRSGIFVISETDHVITVLRMGETQRRILDGRVTGPVEVEHPEPADPNPRPSAEDEALFLTFEFFPDRRNFNRRLWQTEVEARCHACEAMVQPGSWILRVNFKIKAHGRVCLTCLSARKAAVWDGPC